MLILISRPEINWHPFVCEAKNVFGQSPTRALDANGINAGSLLSYIMALGQVEYSTVPPIAFIKSEAVSDVLLHLQFSFLFEIDKGALLQALKIVPLTITSRRSGENECGIMSGTLYQFRKLVIDGLSKHQEFETREFLMDLYQCLLKQGLRDLFVDFIPINECLYLETV